MHLEVEIVRRTIARAPRGGRSVRGIITAMRTTQPGGAPRA